MGRAALKASGVPAHEVDRVDREYRMRDCERLERQSESGDIQAGWERPLRRIDPLMKRNRLRPRPQPAVRCFSSASTIASTTSLCAPSPLFTWMWASSYDGAPFLREAFEGLLGIAVAKLGACVAPRCALGEDVDGGVKPDGDRPIVEKLASSWVDEGAPAGCDHARHRPRSGVRPGVARRRGNPLAIALEDFGRRVAGGVFDRGIAVDEVRPSRFARRRPTVDLPTPIRPTRTTGRSRRFAKSIHPRAIQRLCTKSPRPSSVGHAPDCSPDHRPHPHHRRAFSSFRPCRRSNRPTASRSRCPSGPSAEMRVKPLLVAAAAIAVGLPALAQEVAQTNAAGRRRPAFRRTASRHRSAAAAQPRPSIARRRRRKRGRRGRGPQSASAAASGRISRMGAA